MLVNPPPGHYWIAVDPVRVPASGVEVAFRDTVFREEYGTVNVADDPARSCNGERTVMIEVHVQGRLLDGRALLAEVGVFDDADGQDRSEEHTSELQSLTRNSYAGLCLKTKNQI